MKIILDEFTHMELTRQQRYQLRHERDGLCRLCPDLVAEDVPGCHYCADHLKKQRLWCNPVTKPTPAPAEKKTRAHPSSGYNPTDLI